jgi:hypothetical protein
MTMVRFGNVQFGLMLAMGLSVSMGSTPSHAYTPEQEQACTSDAFRLCSSEIPNVDRVTACMVAKKSQLSPPCRAQFRSGPEPGEAAAAPAGQPISIRPASGRKKPAGTKPAGTKPRKPKPKPKKPKPATT